MSGVLTKVQLIEKVSFLFEPATPEHHRYKILYGGRGSVKSWSFARAALIRGANKQRRNKLRPGEKKTDPIPFRILCTREIQKSIDESVHHLLEAQIRELGLQRFYEVQKTRILGRPGTPAEGTEFFFRGLHAHVTELKSTEAIDIAWITEANKVSKYAWENLIPTIRTEYDDGTVSEIWADFNPELETDEAYRRFVKKPPSNATVVFLSWRDNPWFPKVLEAERLTMKEQEPDDYLTVWEGKVRQALTGAVFAKELRKAKEENRITQFSIEPGHPINTYWDLGRRDHTAIWFIQRVGLQWRVVDFYQNNFEHIDHYIALLQSKGYVYGTHYLPHDAKAKQLGSKRTIEEQVRGAEEDSPNPPRNVVVLPRHAIADQHNALRSLFPNMWFHETNCSEGLSWLGRYRWSINAENEQIKGVNPIHDDASHPASALMQFALAAREPERKKRQKMEDLLFPTFTGEGNQNLGWLGH